MPKKERKLKRDSVLPARRKAPAGERACRIHVMVARERWRGNIRRVRW
jgi:hypothetical protein